MSDYTEGYQDGLRAAVMLAKLANELGASSDATIKSIEQLINKDTK